MNASLMLHYVQPNNNFDKFITLGDKPKHSVYKVSQTYQYFWYLFSLNHFRAAPSQTLLYHTPIWADNVNE